MALEDLVELVEALRMRLEQHMSLLTQNEWLTRYALIDPILRSLAWDTADPGQVRPEFSAPPGRADYALMQNGHPLAMIEAKKVNEPLTPAVITAAINYCLYLGTPYFVLTDGRMWRIYETHRPGTIEQKLIHSLDLKTGSAHQVALQLLCLWRFHFAPGGSTVPVPPPPVPPPPAPPQPDENWLRLSDFQPIARGPRPHALKDHRGTQYKISSLAGLLVAVANSLYNIGKLTADACPIPDTAGRGRYLIHTEKKHPTGRAFETPHQLHDIWLEKNYDGPSSVRQAKHLISQLGQDPADFQVLITNVP